MILGEDVIMERNLEVGQIIYRDPSASHLPSRDTSFEAPLIFFPGICSGDKASALGTSSHGKLRREGHLEPITTWELMSEVRRLQQKRSEWKDYSVAFKRVKIYTIYRYLDNSLDHGDTLLLL